MPAPHAASLLSALQRLPDPRKRRGRRFPFAGTLALTFLGLLCRQADFASLGRWARDHWKTLAEAFAINRPYAPHATTFSRHTERCSLDALQTALSQWLRDLLRGHDGFAAATDGKTSKQGYDADGDPIHMLNIFAHDMRVCLASWPVGDGKETEPEVLKAHLTELFATYPSLRLLTGDALFCQRPLAQLILDAGRDYLLAVKDNQPDLVEATQTAFAAATPASVDAQSIEKKVARYRSVGCGATPRRLRMRGSN
jgi:hypothetical protein